MKICLSVSVGGHLDEIMSIMDAFEGNEIFLVTVQSDIVWKLDIPKVYYVKKGPKPYSRVLYPFQLFVYTLYLFIPSFKILLKEKPDVIIANGGEATPNLFYLGKIMRIKLIYIESLARVKDISKTGRIVYPIVDLFLVQWKNLVDTYKKAKYWGKVV